jgi:hypothetical protein
VAEPESEGIMTNLADGTQPSVRERSTGDLVKLMSEQVSVLVHDELKLAQREVTRKGKQAGTGAGMLGGGGLIALYGVGCLIACAIIAISGKLSAWLAALIVGAALLAIAAIAALLGKGRLQKSVPPVPGQAVASIKADVNRVKESARR